MSHYKISLEETEKVTTIEYYGKQFPIFHRCPNLELRECFGLAVNPIWYRIRDTFNEAYKNLFSEGIK
ncbi:hypothetical protein [Streptococcus pluranimalium]|uniref:hypothetical protein n=1 Tax=Streptococcus pluranimalium TaxID=82348 RepID=UPI003F68E2A5